MCGESRPLRRQPVEVRSPRQAIAIASQDVAGMVVGEDEEEIRPTFRRDCLGRGAD